MTKIKIKKDKGKPLGAEIGKSLRHVSLLDDYVSAVSDGPEDMFDARILKSSVVSLLVLEIRGRKRLKGIETIQPTVGCKAVKVPAHFPSANTYFSQVVVDVLRTYALESQANEHKPGIVGVMDHLCMQPGVEGGKPHCPVAVEFLELESPEL